MLNSRYGIESRIKWLVNAYGRWFIRGIDLKICYGNMRTKTDYLVPDLLLKSSDNSHGDDHYR